MYLCTPANSTVLIQKPGTGKSLTAKATAGILERPLLKLDVGSLFGSLVGETEGNLRNAIQMEEAIAPCVLWLDEIEKAFAGSKSSGSTDGGTSSRVFGSFLSWLQEKRTPVFVVATANDVTQMPPELLRKGRFDELWFVDLPNERERHDIWQIQITKHRRDPGLFDINALAAATAGFTGAEIEQAVIDSLYGAFAEDREPSTQDMPHAVKSTVPLSQLLDQVDALRKWAKGRARPATSTLPEHKDRKIAV
ncbi:MAG: SpoVK/Ycf46/Vps4 family AAA+-type ATPase [Candidatus Azotimanducaceae bacterium]|jgi:SpoVK/Ycf46/Vps4 family AAA+-type ATPase